MTATSSSPSIILIAPNVSEQMGGEAMKALQIYQELVARGFQVHQITHERVRKELTARFPEMSVSYIADNRGQKWFWKSVVLRKLVAMIFFQQAAALAKKLADAQPNAVIHYTAPISPVIPMFAIKGHSVVIGPLNGNIHHPSAFRNRESLGDTLRRVLLVPSQWFHRLFFSGKQSADILLVAGGERTYESLRMAGCREPQFRESLDSGIPNLLREQPLIIHEGRNLKFAHYGRLVPYKGTDLILKSLKRTKNPIELTVIGRGPQLGFLKKLTLDLALQDRVTFIEWLDQATMYATLRGFRAAVFPSLAEANGIVIQEAMMMGLPVICADWGGPALLVTPECGILIPTTSEEVVIQGLAYAMDRLADDPDLANQFAQAGRTLATDRGYSWSDLIERWIPMYEELGDRSKRVGASVKA